MQPLAIAGAGLKLKVQESSEDGIALNIVDRNQGGLDPTRDQEARHFCASIDQLLSGKSRMTRPSLTEGNFNLPNLNLVRHQINVADIEPHSAYWNNG